MPDVHNHLTVVFVSPSAARDAWQILDAAELCWIDGAGGRRPGIKAIRPAPPEIRRRAQLTRKLCDILRAHASLRITDDSLPRLHIVHRQSRVGRSQERHSIFYYLDDTEVEHNLLTVFYDLTADYCEVREIDPGESFSGPEYASLFRRLRVEADLEAPAAREEAEAPPPAEAAAGEDEEGSLG